MKTHYQIVDGNIVFNVKDEEVVVNELTEIINKMMENPYGEDTIQLFVEINEELTVPEDESCNELQTVLSISSPDCDLIINYAAKDPVLVNVDGKFCHYWDFSFSYSSQTDLYSEENYEDVVGKLEDEIITTIEEMSNNGI